MGRIIPLADDPPLSIYQTLSFSFLLAGMAAVIAMSTTLCGIRFGRKTEQSECSSARNQKENNADSISRSSQANNETTAESEDRKENENEEKTEQLPLPPSKQLRETFSCNNVITKSASTRTLGKNMSVKIPIRSMSMARRGKLEERSNSKLKIKATPEDSVWMKTIILGEKCKVPDHEDGPLFFYSKGNRISTFHPRTNSRQHSFADLNHLVIGSQEKGGVARKEEDNNFLDVLNNKPNS